MTSSWALSNRKRLSKFWNIDNFNPDHYMSGWQGYIINGAMRECSPGYVAHPIGNPNGFALCVPKRRYNESSKSFENINNPIRNSDFEGKNGYHKYSADLYDPRKKTQTQDFNPSYYYNRTIPYESYYHINDYIARDMKFDGIGVSPVHTPVSDNIIDRTKTMEVNGNNKYYEYGFSFPSSDNLPLKYDVTQSHQKYPVFKDEKEYHNEPLRIQGKEGKEISEKYYNTIDKYYSKANVISTL